MIVVHLAASPFVGGPERQMLGLASSLPHRSVFLAFRDNGSSRALLSEAERQGHETVELRHDTPHYFAAVREVADHLRRLRPGVLLCNGYKPDVLGWRAARRAGVPVVAVAHGWTAATWKVRLNEALDRLAMRWMDRVVCVSEAQAVKVRRAGVRPERVAVIRNAVRADAFAEADPAYRERLHALFPRPFRHVVGAAGRLSPEKGFANFVEAAALVAREEPEVGFALFGDGPLRPALERQVAERGLTGRFVLAGMRTDLAGFLPHWDLAVLPSFTEGLPVVVLEAFAAGVPVVATAVGGTPEVVAEGENGYLIPSGHPEALARRALDLLRDEPRRRAFGAKGREMVRERFTFRAQAEQYQRLFEGLTARAGRPVAVGGGPCAC
jgi:glycosyltransferase involved in cell wall biosynthesis